MVGLQSFLKEAVPFVAMVLLECGEVGMTTISKAAMNEGMSNFVFIVYYNTLGIIIFIPYYIFQTYRFVRSTNYVCFGLPILYYQIAAKLVPT